MSDNGDSDSAKSRTSTNPTVTDEDPTYAKILEMLHSQEAHITSLNNDVEVLRHSGSVMEQRLQAYHMYMCEYMGTRCPQAYKDMKWTPIITIVDESQALKGKGPAEANTATDGGSGVTKSTTSKKKRRAVLSDDEDEVVAEAPKRPKRLAVNYDTAIYSDTANRSLYALKGAEGYCLTYSVSGFFDFGSKLVSDKTNAALKAGKVRSLKDVLASEEHHKACITAFVIGILHHEMNQFAKKRPLFLESPVDFDDLKREPDVIANVQPEPLRSALSLVLSRWKVPPTEALAQLFLAIIKTAEGYLAKQRNYCPAADFRRIEEDRAKKAALNTIADDNSADGNASSADD